MYHISNIKFEINSDVNESLGFEDEIKLALLSQIKIPLYHLAST